jgi:Fe-S-cluster containining protein
MESAMPERPFDCKLCKICCTGEGGIYLETEEIAPAAKLKGLGVKEFKKKFLRAKANKWEVVCGPDGKCSLLGPEGCTIHLAKPRICRLWPFFPSILEDPDALAEAKEGCPGIHPDATCEELKEYYQEQTKAGD